MDGRMTINRKKMKAMEFLIRQQAARTFIEEALDVKTGREPLSTVLADGQLLCQLIQKIDQNLIPKYNINPKHGAQKRENIQFFNDSVKAKFKMDPYVIIPSDVVEEVFPVKLVDCVLVLAQRIGEYSPERITNKLDINRARMEADFTEEEMSNAEELLKKENCTPMDKLGINPNSSDNKEKEEEEKRRKEEEEENKKKIEEEEKRKKEEEEKKREEEERLKKEEEERIRKEEEERKRKEEEEEKLRKEEEERKKKEEEERKRKEEEERIKREEEERLRKEEEERKRKEEEERLRKEEEERKRKEEEERLNREEEEKKREEEKEEENVKQRKEEEKKENPHTNESKTSENPAAERNAQQHQTNNYLWLIFVLVLLICLKICS
ncbi:putative Calponin homology (CH) domain [Monocercomonoides exilis]|uniref:putative Calponin homology (CH) domain n=1 Tax=Monocercomonoides exilis TaxID=2049356 RepID=UPI00355AB9FA|nr:putative Calponin homology (CH) domain [Monocercomonoides exilis]